MLGLKIPFTADGTEFKKGLDAMRSDTKNFASDIKGYIVRAFGITTAVTALKKLIDMASDLSESVSKNQQIFKENSKDVENWAGSLSRSFGQSKAKALEAVTGFGSMFNVLGVGRQESIEMSKTLVELASDMASFNNTTTDEALLALGSGLRGESEPLRRFSVFLNDATLKAKALEMGIYDGTGTLSNSQKTMAAYNVILEQTSQAQGDFSRTADGAANSQRILAAEAQNQAATLGSALLPAYQSVLNMLKSNSFIEGASYIGKALEAFVKGWQLLFGTLGVYLGTYGGYIMNTFDMIVGSAKSVGTVLAGALTGDMDKLMSGLQRFNNTSKEFGKDLINNTTAAKEQMSELFDSIYNPPTAPTPTSSNETAEKEVELSEKRLKLVDDIAKLEEDARFDQLTLAEKIYDLEKKRKDLQESMTGEDLTSDLESKKEMLEIDKDLVDLKAKQDKEEADRAEKTQKLRDKLAEVEEESKFNKLSEEEKIKFLTKKRDESVLAADQLETEGKTDQSLEMRIAAKESDDQISKLIEEKNKRETDLQNELKNSIETREFEKLNPAQQEKFLIEKRDKLSQEADRLQKSGQTEQALEMKIKSVDVQSEIDNLKADTKEPRIAVSSLAEIGGGGGVSATMIDPALREAQQQTALSREANSILRALLAKPTNGDSSTSPVL